MVRFRLLTFLIVVLGTGLAASKAPAQIEALPRPDSLEAASFGGAVALNDSIAVVGASGASACGPDAGAVFVYERRSGPSVTSWTLTDRIVPQPCRPNAFFGAHVALSGTRLLVSASSEHFAGEGQNAAYVFERRSEGHWTQTTRLTGLPNQKEGLFASGVALDGDRAAVSTSGNPEARHSGAVYVFEYASTTETWTRTAHLRGHHTLDTGVLGGAVALHGPYLAAAASPFDDQASGSVYVFRYDPASKQWHEDAHLPGIDALFINLDLDGSTLLVGEDRAGDNESGRATVYTRTRTTWKTSATLRPSIPYESGAFGSAVALHNERAVVTGYDEQLGKEVNIDRVVYVFRRQNKGGWREETILDLGTVNFGASLDLDGRTVLIGSVPKSETGMAHIAQVP